MFKLNFHSATAQATISTMITNYSYHAQNIPETDLIYGLPEVTLICAVVEMVCIQWHEIETELLVLKMSNQTEDQIMYLQ